MVHYLVERDEAKPEEEVEFRCKNFKSHNSPRVEKQRTDQSSDDETSSSSLAPIPDSLDQIRNELRRTISNIGGTAQSPQSVLRLQDETLFRKSFQDLTRNLPTKEEAITKQMNSANLLLDDMLGKDGVSCTTKTLPNLTQLQRNSEKTQDSEISTTEGTSSSVSYEHCRHASLMPPRFYQSPMPIFEQPSHQCRQYDCLKHNHSGFLNGHVHQQSKSVSPSEHRTGLGKRRSFLERIHNLQVKDKLHWVYRSINDMRKAGSKGKKEDRPSFKNQSCPHHSKHEDLIREPGIPYNSQCHNGESTPGLAFRGRDHRYPKGITFDLVSETDHHETYPGPEGRSHSMTCTCPDVPLQCTCPEPQPQFTSQLKCTCSSPQCTCPTDPPPQCTCSESQPDPRMQPQGTQTNGFSEGSDSPTGPQQEETDSSGQPYKTKPTGKGKESNETKGSLHEEGSSGNVCARPFPREKLTVKSGPAPDQVDIYYFDHGNSAYYRTTDHHPAKLTQHLVDKTDLYASRFWAEVFGTVQVGIAFVTAFFLQLYRCLCTSIIRSLTVGLIQVSSDYFFKPFLTIIFNGIIQPVLILAYNIATSLRDLCEPISHIVGFFSRELAHIIRAFRIVEVNKNHCKNPSCPCGNKV